MNQKGFTVFKLGQQQVQGLDYAYALQGWLKGVNSMALDTSRDMGSDGVSVPKLRQFKTRSYFSFKILR